MFILLASRVRHRLNGIVGRRDPRLSRQDFRDVLLIPYFILHLVLFAVLMSAALLLQGHLGRGVDIWFGVSFFAAFAVRSVYMWNIRKALSGQDSGPSTVWPWKQSIVWPWSKGFGKR